MGKSEVHDVVYFDKINIILYFIFYSNAQSKKYFQC